ncbi:MAG: hypothetical protein LM593_06280 [Candidatus Verstraetearchaeota archaeon]|nr:hypothetical protein [Candidatus Verstraetearchaeota archaeon]
MKKIFSSLLLATLVLSVMAFAIPVKAAVEGQLITSAINNKIYKDQYIEIRVIDNDLNLSPTAYDSALIKVEVKDTTGTVIETVYAYANETFVNSGEFVIYLIVNSSYTTGPTITNATANVTVKPGTLDYCNAIQFNSSFVSDGWSFVITYPEPGSTPKTVTLTYYDHYTTTNADLSLDRAGDTPAYPYYGGYFKLYINDYDLNKDPTTKDSVNLNVTMIDIVNPSINDSVVITFTETGINTGKFVATIQYKNDTTNPGNNILELLNPNANSPIKVMYGNESSYTQLKLVKYSRTLDVAATFTISGDLLIRIIDNNENVKSWDKDTISGYVNVSVGNDYEVILGGNFTETGPDTGVFEYTLPVTIGTQTPNSTKLEFSAGTYTLTVNIAYKDLAGNVLASTTTKLATTAASITSDKSMYKPTDTAIITLTAPDLNLDTSYNIYTVTVGPNSLINNIQVSTGGVNVGNFSIKVNDGYANVTAAGLTLNFVETGANTGVFTANLPLSKIKTTTGGSLSDGDTIKVIWYDLINNVESSVTFTIGVPASSVTLDRTSYPAPKDGPVKVKITVYDPDAGSPSTVDTLTDKINVAVYFANGTQVPGTAATLSPMETGPATYTFTCVYTFGPYISPDIIGGTIKVMYYDESANKWVNATADIRNTDASITANVTRATAGTAIEFIVNDPDANRDCTIAEDVPVTVEYTPAGATSATTTTWYFKETDKSTGIFKYTITIGKDLLVAPGTTIKLTYVDTTPSFITNQMTSYTNQSYTVTVTIPSFSGTITTDKDEYGPFTKITVRVVDPDLNVDITSKDCVTISYKKSGVAGSFPFNLTETDVNTGVFEGTLSTTLDDIGKSIQFFYLDAKDAAGNSVYVSKTVTVAAKTGTIEFDKAYYNIGDLATITIRDNDMNTDPATKQRIPVTVTSTSDPIGTTVYALETDVNTGIFTVTIQISSTLGEAGKIYAKVGDVLYAEYSDTYPSTYSVTNATAQIVKTSAIVGVPVARPVPASAQKFVDPVTGAELTAGTVGKAIGLQATVKNVDVVSKPFTAVFKVKDEAGVTIYIAWISGTLAPGQELTPGVSWTPDKPGNYTVEVMVFKSLAEPVPFSDVISTTLTVR